MPTEFNTDFDDDGDDIIYADHVKQFAQPVNNLESGQAWYRDDIGTDDDYKVDFSTGNVIESYTPGLVVHFKAATDNTGAATLTVRGSNGLAPFDLASIPLVKKGSTPLDTGDILAGQVVVAIYAEDTGGANPRFEVIGGIGGGGGGGGGADKLDDLDDVAITSPVSGQTLRHNGTQFINAAIGVADVTGLQDELDDKQDSLTAISDVPGLQTALDLKQDESEKGQANGYAELDATGKVPAAQLPASATTGVSELDDLDDVVITSPASGQVLKHDGTYFVNAAVGIADVTSLQDELDDKQDTLTGVSDVPGLQTALDDKQDTLTGVSDVPGLQTALDGKQDESEKGQASGYASLDGAGKVPSAQLPAVGIADITDLQDELDDKQDTLTGVSDVPGLQTALDGKQDESEKGQANGYAELDALGKVPAAQLPASATTGVSELDDLDDVVITSPASGQVLKHNGTEFVNAAVGFAEVTGLQGELDDKQDLLTGTTDVPGLDAALSGKANTSHTHSAADITSGALPVARGGTGADNAGDARTNLGAQAQDAALDEISTLTMAKGDIFVHDGTEVSKLSPGGNGQLLSADSTQANGLSWVSGSSGGAPTGTANKVAYFNNAGALSSTANLSYLAATTRMGVGPTAPASTLHVSSAAAGAVDGSTGLSVSRSTTTVAMEAGLSSDSYVGTVTSSAFNLRTNNTARFTLNAAGQCTLFPEISGQKLVVSRASGAVDGTKGIELSIPGYYSVKMEAGTSDDSYVGTTAGVAFSLRTGNIPRFSLNGSGQCTLFPEIIGGQKLLLNGYGPGAVNGNKGIELQMTGYTAVKMEVGNNNDSYVGTTLYSSAFSLRTSNTPRFTINGSGQCTLFPEIIGGQKLFLNGYSPGTVNGNKGIELQMTGYTAVKMEVGNNDDSYVGTTLYSSAFSLRTSNTPRFTINGSGQCTLFPEIIGGQKLFLNGYSPGTVNGNKGIELQMPGYTAVRMEVGSDNDSYVGTTLYSSSFSLRTANIPRLTINGAGQCTLFPELVGGLKLGGFSGPVNGSNGLSIINSSCTVKIEAGSSNDSYVGTVNNGDFNLRRNNSSVITLGSAAAELNNNYGMHFKEATSNGTSHVLLRGPASLAGNVTMTLPATIGTANQVLKTDGSGNLSWGDPHVTGSGATDRIAFWSSSTGLTSASGFTRSGSELVAPTLTTSLGQVFSNDTFVALVGRVSGSLSHRATFGSGQTYISGIRNLGAGNVMYWNNDGELLFQYSRGAHKEDVKPVALSIDDLMKWRPVEFKWKEKFGGSPDVGLIAEEVASIYPLATTSDQPWDYIDEKTGDYAVDERGMPKRLQGDAVVAGVKYEKAWLPMLAAVQDFYKRYQALERRLAAIEKAR